MKKKLALLVCLILVMLCGCGAPAGSAQTQAEAPAPAAESVSGAETENPEQETAAAVGGTEITLEGDHASVNGNGAKADGSGVTITQAGTYTISGTLSDGQLLVDASSEDEITLILSGADLAYPGGAPFFVKKAKTATILLQGENTVTDTENYVFAAGEDEPDSAIFSKADLILDGEGSLTVQANYNMAIHGKDGLRISGGSYSLYAVGDCLKGKDYVQIDGGQFAITAGGDGIQSNDKDVGAIQISGGQFTIDAQQDGIQAEYALEITGGDFHIVTGGGAENAPEHTEQMGFPGWFDTTGAEETSSSAKGLKAGTDLTLTGGVLTLDCMDDALHCGGVLTVADGVELTVSTGDDGLHSDDTLAISGGVIHITKSYEGLEAAFIEISGGEIDLVASDDGLNAAGGSSADTDFDFMGPPGGAGTPETLEDASYYIHITGGTLYVDAGGDGLDSNGALFVEGGTVHVSGPEMSMNGALDYTTTGQITGGTAVICGVSGMAQNFDSSSTQCAFLYTLSETIPAGSSVSLTDAAGNVLAEATMAKSFSSVLISTPELCVGETYTLTCGDATAEVTLTDTITNLGSGGFGSFGGGPGGARGGAPGGGPGMMPPMGG